MATEHILPADLDSDQTPDDRLTLGETIIVDYSALVMAARLLIRAWLPQLAPAPAATEPEGDHDDATKD